jgi:hypothetical protein
MKPITKTLTTLFILYCSISYGQMDAYNFKRELKGISEQWHKIVLPDEVFGKISQDLTDIRIFGVTASNDTIEAPYILRLGTEKIISKDVPFKTLNIAHTDKGHYFTFEIPSTEPINQIKLDFKQKNFDWRVKLEASQNQNDWFTILQNYRILSIKNDITDFQFTKLNFPSSKYRYYRLLVDSKEKPELIAANIAQQEITDGTFRNHTIRKFDINENRKSKQTEINIELPMPVPVSHLKIDVKDSFDYYRPVTIKYLNDSTKTEQGWKYNYTTLTSGTLNSMENNDFMFSSTTVQKLKIFIHNQDNQPLTIDTLKVQGYEHDLLVRFTEPATYFLTYGNKAAASPNYDIDRFTDKVPMTLTTLNLGNELTIGKKQVQVSGPLFKNKVWLWIIIGLTIFVLGWFTMKMMKKE